MAKKTGGLGKGLAAFGLGAKAKTVDKETKPVTAKPMPEAAAKQPVKETREQQPQELELKLISVNPNQPRTEFDQTALEALKESIKQYGVLQPVLVRKTPKGYELIAGERRFRAAKLAGLKTIPVIMREYNDAQMTEVALIENIQRENLNPIEEAQAYQHLLSDYGLTQEMLSNKVGRSRPHIANFLRLLKLSAKVQELLVNGTISMGQAKPLLALEEAELQDKAVDFLVEHELSVRKVEALVKQLLKHPDYLDEKPADTAGKLVQPENIFYLEAEDKLKMLLGTNVRIKKNGKKQRLEIEFLSQDDLSRMLEMFEAMSRNGLSVAAASQQADKDAKLAKLRQFSTTGKFSV